ncbi:ATP-binding protein [Nonomuraea rhodomycinica]|uniref:ATP-binding protein n=1 Tax=Nonomuraea rhodomycinica TaxID=1712872 RepID=A0A7Y6IIV0_9ACTN|nr:ATP-binding protein [Nonomuraea rhodomycinica]NUW38996.1 ATP-binding protein [Nonomuraea rhodomycinica]
MNSDRGQADTPPLLDTFFEKDTLSGTRADAQRLAEANGLESTRLLDFVMAVNECLVNVVAHAGGRGRLRLWHDGDRLLCEIRDFGPGIPASYLEEADLPAPSQVGGRGIWLIRRLTDGAAFATGPGGTTVHMVMKTTR